MTKEAKEYREPVFLVVLIAAGIGLIILGAVLMFQHQQHEAVFQTELLSKFGNDYHWRSVGGSYFGLGAVSAGIILMAIAAILDLVNRALERQEPGAGPPPK